MPNSLSIHRFFVPNSLDNYNYILSDQEHGIIFDPFDAQLVIGECDLLGITPKAILLTHEHKDHIRGVNELAGYYAIDIFGPKELKTQFSNLNVLQHGDAFHFNQLPIHVFKAPGHTFMHLLFHWHDHQNQQYIFVADTLFNAGVGKVKDGDVNLLKQSIDQMIAFFSPNGLVLPSHDYFINNLNFALSVIDDDQPSLDWLKKVKGQEHNSRMTTTLAQEQEFNLFLRLNDQKLLLNLEKLGFTVNNEQQVFTALRTLRDQW